MCVYLCEYACVHVCVCKRDIKTLALDYHNSENKFSCMYMADNLVGQIYCSYIINDKIIDNL